MKAKVNSKTPTRKGFLTINPNLFDIETNKFSFPIDVHKPLLNVATFSCREEQYEPILKILRDFHFSLFSVDNRIESTSLTRLLTRYFIPKNIAVVKLAFINRSSAFFVKSLKWFSGITKVGLDVIGNHDFMFIKDEKFDCQVSFTGADRFLAYMWLLGDSVASKTYQVTPRFSDNLSSGYRSRYIRWSFARFYRVSFKAIESNHVLVKKMKRYLKSIETTPGMKQNK